MFINILCDSCSSSAKERKIENDIFQQTLQAFWKLFILFFGEKEVQRLMTTDNSHQSSSLGSLINVMRATVLLVADQLAQGIRCQTKISISTAYLPHLLIRKLLLAVF